MPDRAQQAFGNGGGIRVLAVLLPMMLTVLTCTVYITNYIGRLETKVILNSDNIEDIEKFVSTDSRPTMRSIGSRVTTLENNQTHFTKALEKFDLTLDRMNDRLGDLLFEKPANGRPR